MKRTRNVTFAISATLLLAVAFASPAYAFSILKQTGSTGDWGAQPKPTEATCGYTALGVNPAQLLWVKVFPFKAGPASGHTTQKITWTVIIQSSADGGSTWKTVATSKTQTGKATQTSSPSFTNAQLSVSGELNTVYRAVGTLHWLTSGKSTGLVKAAMNVYGTKFGAQKSNLVVNDYCPGYVAS